MLPPLLALAACLSGCIEPADAKNDSTSARTLQFTFASPGTQARLQFGVTAEMSDTTRPPVPALMNLPEDSLLTISTPAPRTRWYRMIFEIAFYDSTSGTIINNVLAQNGATIIGGLPPVYPEDHYGSYLIRVADPGNSFIAIDSIVQKLRRTPGVKTVVRVAYDSEGRW